MKLTDLFRDYYQLEGLKIVRLLNLDSFYGLTNSQGIVDVEMVCKLRPEEVEGLMKKTITVEEILDKSYVWFELEEYVNDYPDRLLQDLVDESNKIDSEEK